VLRQSEPAAENGAGSEFGGALGIAILGSTADRTAAAREDSFRARTRRKEGGDVKDKRMLRDTDAIANLAVKDLGKARQFYEGILGFEPIGQEDRELIVYRSGKTTFNVYRSKEAGTNKATAVTWAVGDDVKAIAQELKAKGVTFEHYEMPGLTLQGDIHVGYGMQVAWFKDPDGNILNLVSR
jgi:catechol 2,3-dioxygenase-like lactoylglutathione lyase family enzyme